jgi:hypothetical protein
MLIFFFTPDNPDKNYFGAALWITIGLSILLPLTTRILPSMRNPPSPHKAPQWIISTIKIAWVMWPVWLAGVIFLLCFAIAFIWVLPPSGQWIGGIILAIYFIFCMIEGSIVIFQPQTETE